MLRWACCFKTVELDSQDTSIGKSLDTSLGNSLDTALRDSLDTSLGDSLDTALRDSLDTSLGDSLDTSLGDTLDISLGDSLDTSLVDFLKRSSEESTLNLPSPGYSSGSTILSSLETTINIKRTNIFRISMRENILIIYIKCRQFKKVIKPESSKSH